MIDYIEINDEYCVYCLEQKRDKISCCSENHFVPFADLYEDQQSELLEEASRRINNGI